MLRFCRVRFVPENDTGRAILVPRRGFSFMDVKDGPSGANMSLYSTLLLVVYKAGPAQCGTVTILG